MNQRSEPIGLLKKATVDHYNSTTNKLTVHTEDHPDIPIENVSLPYMFSYDNGVCIASMPPEGSTIIIGQTQGATNAYYFVSSLGSSANIPNTKLGELLLKSKNAEIRLDDNFNINIGNGDEKVHIRTAKNDSLISSSFSEEYHFTQATRNINGLIRRDLNVNSNIPSDLRLKDDSYLDDYKIIGLNPKTNVNTYSGPNKNPPFVENREQIYEFKYDANILDDLTESQLYSDKVPNKKSNYISRRKSRTDVLSLTLDYPNYLMETIKGTVIDIFGNILDLNRLPLPIGKKTVDDKSENFKIIKELERRSLAFHFEMNARKDLSSGELPDINSNADYARNRSRLFLDIDKEGQFKLNIPASSSKGNIPVLARYENYVSFSGDNKDSINSKDGDGVDIYLDSFAAPDLGGYDGDLDYTSKNKGSISIKDQDGYGMPLDRITKNTIKHGTAYHDILSTCWALTHIGRINYANASEGDKEFNINISDIIDANKTVGLEEVVSKEINISGDSANAGGRSGSINLDGSLELNVGANSIDQQSLWLDFAGGIVANVGKDNKNKSLAMNMDGDVYIQVGLMPPSASSAPLDSRFSETYSAQVPAVVDIRIMNNGTGPNKSNYDTIIRIDLEGVKVMTPGRMQFHSGADMKFTSDSNIEIQCENLNIQGRMVVKDVLDDI